MVHLQHHHIIVNLTLCTPLFSLSHTVRVSSYFKSKASRTHIPLWTRWDFAAALVILYCCTLCWVRTFWSLSYIYSVKQRWTKARRSLLIPGLCVDSTLLCCCGKYSFSTQRDREGSMDVSLTEGKSHFSSVAGAVKHMQPFKASRKVLSSQRSDCSHYFITFYFLFCFSKTLQ